MSYAIDQQGPSVLRQYLTLNELRRKDLAHFDPFPMACFGLYLVPTDRRIAKQETDLLLTT
jgi:hypothetical protein